MLLIKIGHLCTSVSKTMLEKRWRRKESLTVVRKRKYYLNEQDVMESFAPKKYNRKSEWQCLSYYNYYQKALLSFNK